MQLGEQQNFGIKTAGLEDKATACQMLVCYARSELGIDCRIPQGILVSRQLDWRTRPPPARCSSVACQMLVCYARSELGIDGRIPQGILVSRQLDWRTRPPPARCSSAMPGQSWEKNFFLKKSKKVSKKFRADFKSVEKV